MSRYGSALINFDTGLKVRVKSETPLRNGAIVKVSSEFERNGGPVTPGAHPMHKTCAPLPPRRPPSPPRRLPEAQGGRQLAGVRRDGRGRVVRADLPQPVRRTVA